VFVVKEEFRQKPFAPFPAPQRLCGFRNRLQNFFIVGFKLFDTLLHLKHNKPKIAPLRG
jgi:hypothetical protein